MLDDITLSSRMTLRLLASMMLTQCFIEVAWCVPQFGVRIFGCCDATADCMPLTARQLRISKIDWPNKKRWFALAVTYG